MKNRKLVIIIIIIIIIFLFFLVFCPKKPKVTKANLTVKDCTSDFFDCSDFKSQEEAQAIFDYCLKQGYGDIHHLDYNNNKIPCENLDRKNEVKKVKIIEEPAKNNKDACQGCCSGHDGVICKDGITLCADGTELSETCREKNCDICD